MLQDEIMRTYASLLSDEPQSETLWHQSVELSDPIPELVTGSVFFNTDSIVSTATEDVKTLKKKMHPFGEVEDIVEQAHPTPVFVQDALKDNGLVENLNEVHERMVGVINKHPNGKLIHAQVIAQLLAVADQLDSDGFHKSAEEVDRLVGHFLTKEAVPLLGAGAPIAMPALIPGAGAAAAGAAATGAGIVGAPIIATVLGTAAVIGGIVALFNEFNPGSLIEALDDLLGNMNDWRNDSDYEKIKSTTTEMVTIILDMKEITSDIISARTAFEASQGKDINVNQQLIDLFAKLKAKFKVLDRRYQDIVNVTFPGDWWGIFKQRFGKVKERLEQFLTQEASLSEEFKKEWDAASAARTKTLPGENETAGIPGNTSQYSKPKATPVSDDEVEYFQQLLKSKYNVELPVTGEIDGLWASVITKWVDELRTKYQYAAAVEGPQAANHIAKFLNANFTVNNVIRASGRNHWDLLLDSTKIRDLENNADSAERMAQTAQNLKFLSEIPR